MATTEERLDKIEDAIVMLARLEVHQAETRNDVAEIRNMMTEQDKRLRSIEVAFPALVEARGYMVKAVIGLCSMVGAAVVGLVLIK
jgi:hypothetical protein